ncbi:MAG TPA: NTP transferase domain-containing protein [Kofleriaceae bacterium]
MKAVILAAGRGIRLGSVIPKTLTRLCTGEPILGRLLTEVARHVRLEDVFVVVGFGSQLVMEAFPDVTFVYNKDFASTNTAASMLLALQRIDDDVLTLNGDLVLRAGLLEKLVRSPTSAMQVTRSIVGDEEVKYLLDETGYISAVSKELRGGIGEAVGANLIRHRDLAAVIAGLQQCEPHDYFERGFEVALGTATPVRFAPVFADANDCVEVDFPADLVRSGELLRSWNPDVSG